MLKKISFVWKKMQNLVTRFLWNSIKLCPKTLIVASKYSFMQDSPLQNNIYVGIWNWIVHATIPKSFCKLMCGFFLIYMWVSSWTKIDCFVNFRTTNVERSTSIITLPGRITAYLNRFVFYYSTTTLQEPKMQQRKSLC